MKELIFYEFSWIDIFNPEKSVKKIMIHNHPIPKELYYQLLFLKLAQISP